MTDPVSTICVVGQGYVGLTLTVAMAQSGYEMIGIEKDPQRVADLQAGIPHFNENGLAEAIQAHMSLGTLGFHESLDAAETADCSIYIIAVGSALREGGGADTAALESAIRSVACVLEPDDTLVIRTTISVGTSRDMLSIIEEEASVSIPDELYLLHAPERTVQGDALAEIKNLPQIVGGYDEQSTDRGAEIFSRTANVIIKVDSPEAAEMIKLFDNTYRDLNIAIGNAFGEIAQHHGLDGQRLISLANAGYDRNNIMQPGAGVGGGCLPKDPYLLLSSIQGDGLLETVTEFITRGRAINESMPEVVRSLIRESIAVTNRDDGAVSSLVLGLAFKGRPGTNDTRNTPARPIIDELARHGTVDAFDPRVEDEEVVALGATPVHPTGDMTSVVETGAYDILVIANNNPAFANVDLFRVASAMRANPILIDGWNVLPRRTIEKLGFHYAVIGGGKNWASDSDNGGGEPTT